MDLKPSRFDRYRQAFDQPLTSKEADKLAADSERELARDADLPAAVKLPKHRHKTIKGKIVVDDSEAVEFVVNRFEGVEPLDVARQLGGQPRAEWVKTARRIHRRNEQTGRPLDGWRGWDDARRIKELRKRRERGSSQRNIAAELGVSHTALQPYWSRTEPARRAA
jgi:hypothetical protein